MNLNRNIFVSESGFEGRSVTLITLGNEIVEVAPVWLVAYSERERSH